MGNSMAGILRHLPRTWLVKYFWEILTDISVTVRLCFNRSPKKTLGNTIAGIRQALSVA